MPTTFGPIDADPVTIRIGQAKPGNLVLTVDFTTTDPNDPIEGEPLILQPSAGNRITIRNYGTQNVSIPVTTADETLKAYIYGGDGDEQATITLGPTVTIINASTDDSKSMTVSYDVEGNNGSGSFPIDVYRSSSDTLNAGDQVAIVQLKIGGTNATNGVHTIEIAPYGTANAAFAFEQAQALRPDPTHRYVLTTADDQGTFNPGDKASPSYSSFRIWLVGAVAHGLDGQDSTLSYFPAPYLGWVDTMADELQTLDGYDTAIPFHWEKQSVLKQPDQTLIAGASLALDVEQTATVLAYELGPNDVIDVNFIGYSRGTVVVSQALQELESTTIPALKSGFMMETLVDPHPANNDIPPGDSTPQYSVSLFGYPTIPFYLSFQAIADDPNVVIPSNVQAAVDFYQHSDADHLNYSKVNSSSELLLNLWGELPSLIANDSSATLLYHNESSTVYGHGEMMYNPVSSTGVPSGFYESQELLKNQTLQALGLKPFVGNSPGDPIVVTTQPPATVTAGVPFGLVVTAENSDGSVNTSYNGIVTLDYYDIGTLGGKTSVAAVNGVATFSGLTLNQASSYDLIDVIATGQSDVYTKSFSVVAAAATTLSVVLPYNTPVAGTKFSMSVDAVDAYGNTDPTYNGAVTIALAANPGGGTLSGTLTVNAVNGVATFSNVTISAPGVGYTIKATAPGLTAGISASLTVQDELVVTTQPPTSVTAGVPFGLVVTDEDAKGNVNTSFNGPVTIAPGFISSAVSGTLTVNAVNGVATFTNLLFTTASSYNQLTASATGVQSVSTNQINVVPAPASQLVGTLHLGVYVVGSPIRIVFDAEDPLGNIDTNYNGSVALTVAANPGGAVLGGTVTTTVVKGVATFSGVTISAPGVGYIVQATAAGLKAGISTAFTVEDQLVVTTQPSTSLIAGAPFSVAVSVEDGLGNLITSYNGAVSVAGAYTLGGTKTVNAVNGVATFNGLSIATVTSYDYLDFSATGLVSATSNNFSVVAATPTQLVVVSPGGPFIAGAPIKFTVDAEDGNGNIATTYTGSETLSLVSNPGGASLGGTLTVNAVNGVATFSGVTISAAGVGYTVKATAAGLTAVVSSSFTVEDELVVTTQPPSPVTAGVQFTAAVTVEDGTGKVITSYNGPVTVADAYFYTLGGKTTVNAVNGVATVTGLTLSSPTSTDGLSFSATGLQGVASKNFSVVVGMATQLVVVAPGGPFLVGAPITIKVDAKDSSGNLASTYTGSVTLAFAANPGGANLGGTLTVSAVQGVATFTGLTLDEPGVGYTVKATAAGLTAGVSAAFNVQDQLVVTTQPPVAIFSNVPFTVAAAVEDGLGHAVTSYNGPVTIADFDGYKLGGITTVNAVNGVATFSGLTLASVINSTELTLTSPGLQGATTSTFGVAAAVATQLVVLPPGGPYLTGSPFRLVVEAEDAAGNVSTTFSGAVSFALVSNPGAASLGGTVTVNAVNGVATFGGVTVSRPGAGYTLRATSSGLTAGASSAFTVEDKLVVASQPAGNVAAGAPFTVAAAVENAAGTVNSSYNGLVTIADASGAALGGPKAVYAVNGVATFAGLSLTAAGVRSLVVSAQGVQGGQTATLTIVPAAATALTVVPPTGPYLVGAPIRVVVDARDAYGNVATSYGGTVSLSLAANPGSAALGGTVTAVATNGVATFTGATVGAPGVGDILQATAPGLTPGLSSPFDVEDQLVVTKQPPSAVTAGVGFTVVASVQDGLGNVDTSYNGPVTVGDAQGYSLSGTRTVNAVNGVVTFVGLTLTRVSGPDALALSASKMRGTSTSALAVTAAPASTLTLSVPYGPLLVGASFGVTIQATDPYGNIATSYNGNVTLSLAANPGSAALGGTVTAPAQNGLATFNGVSVSAPGVGYVLKATAPGLTSVTSPAFTVEDQIVITTTPSGPVTAGSTFTVVATVEDGLGNTVTSFTGLVTLADSRAGKLTGTTSVNAVKGVATFGGLGSTFAATHSLTIRATGLQPATASVVVSPGAATQLEFEGPYGSGSANLVPTPFSLEVDTEDAYGNLAAGFSGNVTLALSTNPTSATLGGTLTVAAVGGVVDFNGLTVDKPGNGYVLSASASGLTKALSPPFGRTDALVVSTPPPSTIVAGASFGLVVEAQAAAGVPDTSYNGTVSVSLNSFAGGYLNAIHGNLTAEAVNGVATFSGLTITQSDFDGFDIAATGLADAYTNFNVIGAPASQLVITSPPPEALTAGAPFTLTVAAEDAYGDLTPGYFGTVTLALSGGTAGVTLGGTLSATLSQGVATFTGLTVNKAGTGYAITTQTGGLSNAVTMAFAVTTAGTGTHLVVSAEPPASIPVGAPFGLVVQVEDDLGTVDRTFNGPVTVIDDSGNTLGGTVTLNAVNGVATFAGLSLQQANATDALTATAAGLAPATTTPFAIIPAPASRLVVSAPTGAGVLVGATFSLVVDAEDTSGNIDPNYNGAVTLALGNDPGSAKLGGTLTANAVDGVATFSGLTLSAAGTGFTLTASASGVTAGTSPGFDVTLDDLVVTTQPAGNSVGAPFGLVVSAEGRSHAIDPTFNGPVTLTLLNDTGGAPTIGGNLVVDAVNGVATFTGLTISQRGTYAFLISSAGLAGTATNPFTIAGLPTSQLVVIVPPLATVTAGAPFAFTIAAEDTLGDVDSSYSGTITLTLSGGPSGATLGGTVSAVAVDGLATFTGVTVSPPGTGYTLSASAAGLTAATSPAFSVGAVGAATQLVVTTEPPASVASNAPFTLTVTAEDMFGDIDPSFHGTVTLSLGANPSGGSLAGTVSVQAVNGVATFTGLTLLDPGSYAITAGGGGLVAATTGLVAVNPPAATHLVVDGPGGPLVTGAPFALEIDAENALGQVDPGFNGSVTLSLHNSTVGQLGGTLTVTAVDGVAIFAGLALSQAGGGDTIEATAAALAPGLSQPFDVDNDQLVVTTPPPAGLTVGGAFRLTVSAETASGAVDKSFSGTVDIAYNALSSTAMPLKGALVATAVNGVATFSGLSLTLAGLDDLVISANAMAGTSVLVAVSSAPASQLVVTAAPPAAVSTGSPFALTVSAEDAQGNVDPTYAGTVTLTLAGGTAGARLGGTVSAVAVNGVATFAGLNVSAAGTGYTIKAVSGSLTAATTLAFRVTAPGTATQLVVTGQPPTSVAAGSTFTIVVKAEDSHGTVDTGFNGAATIVDGDGNALSGTTTVNAVNGVATFNALSLGQAAANDDLVATATGLVSAVSSAFGVTAVPATRLVVAPPADVLVGSPFGLTVEAEDASGNVDPTYNGAVTLTLATNPGGASLGGPLTAPAVDGVATFTGLTLSAAGSGYTLAAASAPLASETSTAFDVTQDRLMVTAQPPTQVVAGAPFGLVVAAEGASGQVDPAFNGKVTVALATTGSGRPVLGGIVTVNAVNGVATFSGLTLGQPGSYTLVISGGAIGGASTDLFNTAGTTVGNYLGMGSTDPAVFRRVGPDLVDWFVRADPPLTGGSGRAFGAGSLDVPVSGDFDGDGRTDPAVYRPSTAHWYVLGSASGYASTLLATFGAPNTDIPVPADYNGSGTAVPGVFRPTTGQWFVYAGGNGHNVTLPATFPAGSTPVPGDYDGVGRDEAAVYVPGTSQWLVESPGAASAHVFATFGGPADIPVPGAYDATAAGSRALEAAVWRPATGQFFIHGPAGTRVLQFAAGDIPAPGDYDGAGETEAAVYRPSTGQWLVQGPGDPAPRVFAAYGGPADVPPIAPYAYRITGTTLGNYLGMGSTDPAVFRRVGPDLVDWFVRADPPLTGGSGRAFGAGSLDVPVSGDFDGDGRTDPAVYRPSTAHWYVLGSASGYASTLLATFGTPNTDIPVPADYNGSGTAVPGVFRPTTGQWFVYAGGNGHNVTLPATFPAGSTPVPGDYDGVGRDEAAVYVPGTSQWLVESPGAASAHVFATFGGPADIPVPGAYDATAAGSRALEAAVWRPATGQFFIHGPAGTRVLQFAAGDIPAPGDYDGAGETEAAVYRPSTGQWLVQGPGDPAPRVFAAYGGPADVPPIAPYAYRALKSGSSPSSASGLGQASPLIIDLSAIAPNVSRASTPPPPSPSPLATVLAAAITTSALPDANSVGVLTVQAQPRPAPRGPLIYLARALRTATVTSDLPTFRMLSRPNWLRRN